jgi:hypothetical protein
MHVGIVLIFQANLEISYIYAPYCCTRGSLVSSVTFTWNVVNTLIHLFGFCKRSSFHQCSTECLFSLENTRDIYPVSNTFKFLRATLSME